MADSTKNGGEQTRFETKYHIRVTEISGKYQDPAVRETFRLIVDYCASMAKDAAQYRHKKEGEELLKALEHDIDYGLQLNNSANLAEKICNALDVQQVAGRQQMTALELKAKELEGTLLHYQGLGKKLEETYQAKLKDVEHREDDLNGKMSVLAPMAEGLENGRREVYAAKRDFYELAVQVMEVFGDYVKANAIPADPKHKDLSEKLKVAVAQLTPTKAELEFLARSQQTKPSFTIREKPHGEKP